MRVAKINVQNGSILRGFGFRNSVLETRFWNPYLAEARIAVERPLFATLTLRASLRLLSPLHSGSYSGFVEMQNLGNFPAFPNPIKRSF